MKIRPKPEDILVTLSPCNADSSATRLALQEYTADCGAPGKHHDHILRAALLANGCAAKASFRH